nr:MAG TPA: hypothetical protein [Caudoviricetes sp.]
MVKCNIINLLFYHFSTLTTFCSTFPRSNNLKSG